MAAVQRLDEGEDCTHSAYEDEYHEESNSGFDTALWSCQDCTVVTAKA